MANDPDRNVARLIAVRRGRSVHMTRMSHLEDLDQLTVPSRPLNSSSGGRRFREDYMMAKTIPLASYEVRWFFEGKADQHESLKHWFETVAHIPKYPGVGPLVWNGWLDNQPDLYLRVPG